MRDLVFRRFLETLRSSPLCIAALWMRRAGRREPVWHTEAEHPIRHLHVVLEPIGSLPLRLKIDNCRREQQGEKAFWETWTHLFPHPPSFSIIEKD